jgi:hypothetical protein
VDELAPEVRLLLDGYEQRRRKLAALSFADKIRILVRLQHMAAPIQRARGRNVRPWELPEEWLEGESYTPPPGGSGDEPDPR